MYIEQLRITNVKCFADLHIDFRDGKGEPRKWTLLVGENGTGKSTVLQAIALAICGLNDTRMLSPLMRLPVPRLGSAAANQVRVYFWSDPSSREVGAARNLRDVTLRCVEGHLERKPQPIRRMERPSGEGDFVAGYGPTRRLQTHTLEATGPPTQDRLRTLFDENAPLRPISAWLQQADYASKGSSVQLKQLRGERTLQQMKEAITALLPDLESADDIEVSPEGVFFHTVMGRLPASALSDGYRGMLAWVVDMLGYLSMAFPDAENLLECEGVVLVDEVDAHLHPSWQRQVVPTLRKTFPNMQFIVTTHSPLTVAGAMDGEVVVLRRDGDKVVADTELDAVRGWRVDQILTSDIFGLESTRDIETEEALRERERLLSKRTLGEEEKRQLEELGEQLQQALPPPGDTKRERQEMRMSERLADLLEEHLGEDEIRAAKSALQQELRGKSKSRQANRGNDE